MLGHGDTGRGHDYRGGSGNIKEVSAIASRSYDIYGILRLNRYWRHQAAHHCGGGGNLTWRLASEPQRH
jgi:hypothetical protein